MLPASFAACVPEFIATATSACASAGASLVAVGRSSRRAGLRPGTRGSTRASLPAWPRPGSRRPRPRRRSLAAVSLLSPVIMIVLMPMRASSAKRSLMPPLTMSLSSITPSAFDPSDTTSGVLPRRATSSAARCTSGGQVAPSASTCLRIASPAPFADLAHLAVDREVDTAHAGLCGERHEVRAQAPPFRASRRLNFCFASTAMLRPSGVSSASEASWAASASACSLMPMAGMNAEAWRLPSVMVPGLVHQQHVDVAGGFDRAGPRSRSRWTCIHPAHAPPRRSPTAARRSWSGSGRRAARSSVVIVTTPCRASRSLR